MTNGDRTFDVVIAGASHEALVAASYLGSRGAKVAVVGDPAAGWMAYRSLAADAGVEAYWSVGLEDLGLLHPSVVEALSLSSHGLKLASSDLLAQVAPGAGSMAVPLGSTSDGEMDEGLRQLVARTAGLMKEIEPLMLRPSSREDLGLFVRRPDLLAEVSQAANELLNLSGIRVAGDGAGAGLGLQGLAVSGQQLSPRDPGSGLLLLLNLLGSGDGGLRPYRAAQSMDTGFVAALVACAGAASVEVVHGIPKRVVVERGVATGLELESGEQVGAAKVLSGLDARQTLLGLVGPAGLPLRTVRQLKAIRYRGSQARMAVLLEGEPEVWARPGHRWFVAGPNQVDIACDDARLGRWSRRPWLDIQLSSKLTAGLAPEGHSLLTVSAQSFPYLLRGGWTAEARDGVQTAVLEQLATLVPELRSTLVAHELLLPVDLEQQFGCSEGQLQGGELGLDQSLALRSVGAGSGGETVIENLHMCSGAIHPGGLLLGLPGLLCAQEVALSLGLDSGFGVRLETEGA